MKNIFSLLFLMSASFLLAQNESQVASQKVAEANYKMQVSNGAFEKAEIEMRSSAAKSSVEKSNQLDDDFEFNFSEKEKLESRFNSAMQKKHTLESKSDQSKSSTQISELKEKLASIDADLGKLTKKLKENEEELKILQESYRNQKK